MPVFKLGRLLLERKCKRCMSTFPRLHGFMAAPYTPFANDGEINFSKFEVCYKNFVKNHFNGLFVNGTLAEGLSQSNNERKKTAEKWMEVTSDKMQIILHIGTGNLQESKDLAIHGEELGVTAIAALPPTYHKPTSEEQLVDYIEQVAAAAPKTPFIYYDYNIMTGVYLDIPRFLDLAEQRIPTLVGLKHTSPELHSVLNCSTVCGGKYQVLFGTEMHYLPSLSIGISDVITSPNMGPFFHDLKTAFDSGNMKEAAKIQRRTQQLMNIQTKFGGGIAGSKAMFELLTGIDVGPPRLPLHGFTKEKKSQMRSALQDEYYPKCFTVWIQINTNFL